MGPGIAHEVDHAKVEPLMSRQGLEVLVVLARVDEDRATPPDGCRSSEQFRVVGDALERLHAGGVSGDPAVAQAIEVMASQVPTPQPLRAATAGVAEPEVSCVQVDTCCG
jgi:hypothetical protein